MPSMRTTHLLTTMFLLITTPAMAQQAPAPATQDTTIPVLISHADCMAAYMRFEQAYAEHAPSDAAARLHIHRAFDVALMSYLSSQSAEAIQRLNDLTDSLNHPDPASRPAAEALIHSLLVRVWPPVAMRQRPTVLRIRVSKMYPVPMDAPVEVRLIIRTAGEQSKTLIDQPIRIDAPSGLVTMNLAQPETSAGSCIVELVGPDKTIYPAGRWTVADGRLDITRLNNSRRIQTIRPANDEIRHAIDACVSRNNLLVDRPDDNSIIQMLIDPLTISREVQGEIESILQRKNPYKNRAGDYWRTILVGAMDIPARIYAPPKSLDAGKPMPLLIVLHGAGGDENTVMECAGRGQIKKLADEHGFVVVTPNTFWVERNLSSLDSIIQVMASLYQIDESRVFLIGNSYGAQAASQIAGRQSAKIAGMVLFGGADLRAVDRLPTTLLYAGDADLMFPPEQAQSVIQYARRMRLPVELRPVPGAGNGLIVDDRLGEAVEWFLKKGGTNP
jgi:predicted esterase